MIGGGTGDWDVPVGGMGAVSGALAEAARGAGAELRCDAEVLHVSTRARSPGATRPARSTPSTRGTSSSTPRRAELARLLRRRRRAAAPPEGAQLKVNVLL